MSWQQAADDVLNELRNQGFEAYIVGGAVRDQILGRQVQDIDVTTNATVQKIQAIFPKVIGVGIQHGTLIIPIKGKAIEVSTFKGATIIDDLIMRDFTINAIAIDHRGQMIDPFGGETDLNRHVLRTVTEPRQVFLNDPIRLIRALRFTVHLQLTVTSQTQQQMDELATSIFKTAVERIAAETEKIRLHPFNGVYWKWLYSQLVFQQIPFLFKDKNIKNFLCSQKKPYSFDDALSWWTFALYNVDESITKEALKYYKRSKKLTKDVITIQTYVNQFHNHPWERYDLYRLGEKRLTVALELLNHLHKGSFDKLKWLNTYDQLPISEKSELKISGEKILNLVSEAKGWWIGETIDKIEKAVVNGEIENDECAIVHWLKETDL